MDVTYFLEDLTKKGYTLHEDLDSYTLIYGTKNHLLTNALLTLNRANNAYHFVFKKTNPKVIISGFVDTPKQLNEKYNAFVAAVKLASKPTTMNISPLS